MEGRKMKKGIIIALLCCLSFGCFAAEIIYRGDSTDEKDIICYYQGGNFYRDAARKEVLYAHPGNMVAKDAPKASPENSIFRLQGNRIFTGYSINQEDCLATILETRIQRGDVLEAVIYKGFVTFKDTEEKREAGGITIITQYNVQENGQYVPGELLYTIKDNKIYRGDSTEPDACLLTFTGGFNSARLLFMAIELTKTASGEGAESAE